MTRQPHDQFAKQYLEELLAPLGEAEPLFKEALAIAEQVLGATHPNTITFCKNLALLQEKISQKIAIAKAVKPSLYSLFPLNQNTMP